MELEVILTSDNSGYMVPLRSTQIFASLRSAKTSYSRDRYSKDFFIGLFKPTFPTFLTRNFLIFSL
jgi:hypothetical protein